MELELERREGRLMAARRALAELSSGSVGRELLDEIDSAHRRVEAAERRLASACIPGLTALARRRLAAAEAKERDLLAAHGFASWLALQMRRVDLLFDVPSPMAAAAAEAEYRLALAAWQELAGEDEPEPVEAPALRFPRVTLGPDTARPAVA